MMRKATTICCPLMMRQFVSFSECEPRLQFQAAIVGGLGKSKKASSARGLIRAPEQRRCHVANNRPGLRMVQDILHLHAESQTLRTVELSSASRARPRLY